MALRNSASEPSPLSPFRKRVQIALHPCFTYHCFTSMLYIQIAYISLLYSPWGPFPDRFVQHLAFRPKSVHGQKSEFSLDGHHRFMRPASVPRHWLTCL